MGAKDLYKDKFYSYENLLLKNKTVKINVRNLKVQVTKMFKRFSRS